MPDIPSDIVNTCACYKVKFGHKELFVIFFPLEVLDFLLSVSEVPAKVHRVALH